MNRYKAHTQSGHADGVAKYKKGFEQHMAPEGGLGDALHIKFYNNVTDGHFFAKHQVNMKNNYKFINLKKEHADFSQNEKSEIFFLMTDFITDNTVNIVSDTVTELKKILNGDLFFIAHNFVSMKGKRKIFNGDLAIAQKFDLIDFIENSIAVDDLRSFLISPIFKSEPDYVIYIGEDAYFSKYKNH